MALYHTIREAGGHWDDRGWGDSGLPESVFDCAAIGTQMHVAMVLPSSDDILHSIRLDDQRWSEVDRVRENGGGWELKRAVNVCCAGVEDSLQMFILNNDHQLWHSIKPTADAKWQAFGHIADNCTDFRCAGVGADLHVCAVVDGVFKHNARRSDGGWSRWEDLAQASPNGPGPVQVGMFDCTGIGPELHLVASGADGLMHAVSKGGDWQPWEAVSAYVKPLGTSFENGGVKCGAAGNQLHVLVRFQADAFKVRHTFRSSATSWQTFWGEIPMAGFPGVVGAYSCAGTKEGNLHIVADTLR